MTIQILTTEFVRPADTTAYTNKDVIGTTPGTVMTFAGAAPKTGGVGCITNALVRIQGAWGPSQSLVFYSTAPSAVDDNSPWPFLYASDYIGSIPLIAESSDSMGSGSDSTARIATLNTIITPSIVFRCAAGSRDIYAVLVAMGNSAPTTSAARISVSLTIDWQNE